MEHLLAIEDLEKLARRRTLELADGETVTLDPSVEGFVSGDIHAPCEGVEFRRVSNRD